MTMMSSNTTSTTPPTSFQDWAQPCSLIVTVTLLSQQLHMHNHNHHPAPSTHTQHLHPSQSNTTKTTDESNEKEDVLKLTRQGRTKQGSTIKWQERLRQQWVNMPHTLRPLPSTMTSTTMRLAHMNLCMSPHSLSSSHRMTWHWVSTTHPCLLLIPHLETVPNNS